MKKEKGHIAKIIILIILLIGLSVPIFQQYIKPFKEKPLSGSYKKIEPVKFKWESWLSGEYQEHQERYLNQGFGFRPTLVRIYNQIQYNLYQHTRAKNIVKGKNNFFYEESYILESLGRNFVGYDTIQKKVKQLDMVQQKLEKLGKEIILLIAPGKGSFYSEYIPDSYRPQEKTITNYEAYLEEFLKTEVHILDFKKWFDEMKPHAPYPLFPNAGTHWSTYGESLVADSLINYIASLGYNKKNNFILSEEVKISPRAIGRDNDIEQAMNLLFDIPSLELAYPSYSFEKIDSAENVPVIWVMGDSFYWDLYENDILNQVFSSPTYWYYNYDVHSTTGPMKNYWNYDYREEIDKCDIILMVITEGNFKDFSFDFVEALEKALENK